MSNSNAPSSPKRLSPVKRKRARLRVQADGKRRYISVPEAYAKELHQYLRNNHVHSAPPEPAYTGFDSIELQQNIDVDSVQDVLNKF